MLRQPAGLHLIEKCLIGSSSVIPVVEAWDTPFFFSFEFQRNLKIILLWQRRDDVPADIGMESWSWLACSTGQSICLERKANIHF